MKKLILLITGLLLLLSAEGQILRYGNSTYTPPEEPAENYGVDELWDGHTKAWFEYDTAVSVTDNAVTQWNDLSGNGYHLLPYATDGSAGTADNRPAWHTTDGITFDGTDDAMRVMIDGWSTFGTVYAVVKAVSWNSDDVLFAYGGTGSVRVSQKSSTPNIAIAQSSGTVGGLSFTLGEVGILVLHTNEATPISTLSLNGGEPIENTGGMVGYTSAGIILGANHTSSPPALQRWGNVIIYEIIWRDQVDSGATLTAIYNYLDAKY